MSSRDAHEEEKAGSPHLTRGQGPQESPARDCMSAEQAKPDRPLQLDPFKLQTFLALLSTSKCNERGLGSP